MKKLTFDNYDYLIYIFVFSIIFNKTGEIIATYELGFYKIIDLTYIFCYGINLISFMICVTLLIKLYKKSKKLFSEDSINL